MWLMPRLKHLDISIGGTPHELRVSLKEDLQSLDDILQRHGTQLTSFHLTDTHSVPVGGNSQSELAHILSLSQLLSYCPFLIKFSYLVNALKPLSTNPSGPMAFTYLEEVTMTLDPDFEGVNGNDATSTKQHLWTFASRDMFPNLKKVHLVIRHGSLAPLLAKQVVKKYEENGVWLSLRRTRQCRR